MTSGMIERLARLRARMEEQTDKAARLLVDRPAVSPAELMKAATDALEACGEPLPRDLVAIQNREAVERLSREGMSVREIARTVGLSYGHTSFLRRQLGVARARRKAR